MDQKQQSKKLDSPKEPTALIPGCTKNTEKNIKHGRLTRKQMIGQVTIFVDEWLEWRIKLDTDCLGYPSSTAEARLMDGTAGIQSRKPTSRVPRGLKGYESRVMVVDRAVRDMPVETRAAFDYRHGQKAGNLSADERMEEYRRVTGMGKNGFYNLGDEAMLFIAGRLL